MTTARPDGLQQSEKCLLTQTQADVQVGFQIFVQFLYSCVTEMVSPVPNRNAEGIL